MAAADTAQERTEQASAKRLDEAREQGQVPRSRELATTLILVGSAGALWSTSGALAGALRDMMTDAFVLRRDRLFEPAIMLNELHAAGAQALHAMGPLLLVTVVTAVGGTVLLGGLNFSPQTLGFKWERLDPFKGVARMFALRSLVELVKALAKFLLLLGCGFGALYAAFDAILVLNQLDIAAGLASSWRLAFWAFVAVAAGTVLIALIDVPYQWWEHQRELRMSRQEQREENKESEGSPEVRQRVRALQQEFANRRMMEEVPKADVVITNPTHYAVALRFDPATMAAPRLIAKGADHVALRIRESARAHHVTMLEAPALARAIFRSTKIGHEIPAGLYVAVAQVLAYVFQLKRAMPGAVMPILPAEFFIPPELRE